MNSNLVTRSGKELSARCTVRVITMFNFAFTLFKMVSRSRSFELGDGGDCRCQGDSAEQYTEGGDWGDYGEWHWFEFQRPPFIHALAISAQSEIDLLKNLNVSSAI